jgi:hypothetical protein
MEEETFIGTGRCSLALGFRPGRAYWIKEIQKKLITLFPLPTPGRLAMGG